MYQASCSNEMPSYGKEDLAYYLLAENIEDKFPEGAQTLGSIYLSITRPLGLTKPESNLLVHRAIKEGYVVKI